jgi:hypothetical protein
MSRRLNRLMRTELDRAESCEDRLIPGLTFQEGKRRPYLLSQTGIDGSVSDRVPIRRFMGLHGVNYTSVSQTNPVYLLAGGSNAKIMGMIRSGERATWPQIERIRIQTCISRRLDGIIRKLESSLIERSRRKWVAKRRSG